MVAIMPEMKKKPISAHGREVLRRKEVCDLLGITRPALNDKINRKTIQSYVFVDGYKKLLPVGPGEVGRDQERVFLGEEIRAYIAEHPVVGKTPQYNIDEDDRTAIMTEAELSIATTGAVSIQQLKLMMNKRRKRPSASLPFIMSLIDENRWPLDARERAEIDDMLKEGTRLYTRDGYVRRRDLAVYMHEKYGKSDQFYPILAYCANRAGWPMDENSEKIAAKRRAGRLNRHLAKPHEA
jgi:hypothetical protein